MRGPRLSVGVVHGMEAIRSRAKAGYPMKAWDYYSSMGLWESFKPFVQEAHDDRLELLFENKLLRKALKRAQRAADQASMTGGVQSEKGRQR